MQTGLYSGVVKIVGLLRGCIIVKPEKGLSLGNRHMGNRRNNSWVVHLFFFWFCLLLLHPLPLL